MADSSSTKCRHGNPVLEDKAQYKKGLQRLLQIIAKYTERKSRSVGPRSAHEFMHAFPQLVNRHMIAFLVTTGVTMLLKGDPRAKFVVQCLAEVVGYLEKKVQGFSTMKEDLKFQKDAEGYKRTKESHLVRFFEKRIACTCLDEMKAQGEKEVKMGTCSFAECGERKPLKHLAKCAGCMQVCYCCPDCQRNDWPTHYKECKPVDSTQTTKRDGSKKNTNEGSTRESTTESTECETEFDTESESSNEYNLKGRSYRTTPTSTGKKSHAV